MGISRLAGDQPKCLPEFTGIFAHNNRIEFLQVIQVVGNSVAFLNKHFQVVAANETVQRGSYIINDFSHIQKVNKKRVSELTTTCF